MAIVQTAPLFVEGTSMRAPSVHVCEVAEAGDQIHHQRQLHTYELMWGEYDLGNSGTEGLSKDVTELLEV